MPTSYTSLLGLALPVTGELSGTWGDIVNDSITSLLDSSVAGTTTLSTDADVTLTTTSGASNQARQAILLCTGARTVQRTVTAPAQSKAYIVVNATTGGQSVKVVGAGPTTGVTVENGERCLIAWNGSDFVKVAVQNGTGTFTALTASGQITSTVSTGTAPLVVASTTKVANLNVDLLDGGDWASPGAIGSTTPSTGAFTTLSASGTASTPVVLTRTGATGVYQQFLDSSGSSVYIGGASGAFQVQTPSGGYSTKLSVTDSGAAVTGAISAVTGSASVRGLTLSGASNTQGSLRFGSFDDNYKISGGADYLGMVYDTLSTYSHTFNVGGTARGVFSSTGLAVTGALSATGQIKAGSGGATPTALLANVTPSGTEVSLELYQTGVETWKIKNPASSTDLVFANSGAERVRLIGAGGVAVTGALSATGRTLLGGSTSAEYLAVKSPNASTYLNIETATDSGVYVGNASGALTLSTAGSAKATLDTSGNLGLGVTPSAWGGSYKAIQSPAGAVAAYATSSIAYTQNAYDSGIGAWKYINSGVAAGFYNQSLGTHSWYTAPSGTAGNAIAFTQAMTLDASGNLLVGTTALSYGTSGRTNFALNGTTDAFYELQTGGVGRGYLAAGANNVELAAAGYLSLTTSGSERARIDSSGNFIHQVNGTAPTLSTNSTMSFELTSNTSLKVVVRGSDGVTRSATLTLS